MKKGALEKIEKHIKETKVVSDEFKNSTRKKVFVNLMVSVVIMLALNLLLIGQANINSQIYAVDLQVFSMLAIVTTIIIFEIAYKKDSNSLALCGVESLIISFGILSLNYIFKYNVLPYRNYLLALGILFSVYYIIKACVVYMLEKRKYKRNSSDIQKILK